MRDLSKTKVTHEWRTETGLLLAQVREGKRGAQYLCFMIPYNTALPGEKKVYTWKPRDARDMRMSMLTEYAKLIGGLIHEGTVDQRTGEIALDLIYAELNERLTKGKK